MTHCSARFASLALPLLALLGAGGACTSTEEAKAPNGLAKRDTEIKHEPCDPNASGAQKVDVNGDGKPDIIHVMSGGREVCRILDLNLDGTVDAYVYYDEQGRERRRESDFDRDGRADEIALYKDGHLYLKMRETNFDNKLDTWDYYENDRLVRRERDSDGDGIIDQWWTFNDPANPKCATVATDRNGLGKPDPSSVVDLCGESYTGPAGATGKAAPSAAPSASPKAAPVPSGTPAAAPTSATPVSNAAGSVSNATPTSSAAVKPAPAPKK